MRKTLIVAVVVVSLYFGLMLGKEMILSGDYKEQLEGVGVILLQALIVTGMILKK